MRCQEKIPAGKLVCVEVWTERGQGGLIVGRVEITGDFFLHPEDAVADVERSLAGLPLPCDEADVRARICAALGNATLIGASPEDLARMFMKAAEGDVQKSETGQCPQPPEAKT